MSNEIINFCKDTERINGLLELCKNDFLNNYFDLTAKERSIIHKSLPYVYRMWYYSALMENTPLSPANFIKMQLEEKFGEDSIAVPLSTPVLKNKKVTYFKHEFKLFNIDNHPVLNDLEQFLQYCIPDVSVDENGLLLEEERSKIIDSMTFNEIFYITFLTNISYELGLLKKLPSINIYKSMIVTSKAEAFFKMSKEDQLRGIIDAAVRLTSKQLSEIFFYDRKAFSESVLRNLLLDARDLNEFLENILKKFGLNFDDLKPEELMQEFNDDPENFQIDEETVRVITIRMELAFYLEAFLITPLSYYLQLIQPIFIDNFDFGGYFYQLLEGANADVPLIRLFFPLANGFDITVLGKKLLLNGKEPKHSFQKLMTKIDFDETYKSIMEYNSDDILFNRDDEELLKVYEDIDKFLNSSNKSLDKKKSSPKISTEEVVTDKNVAYVFKVKNFYNKRSWKSLAFKGTNNVDKLAEVIIKNFDLDYGHLYSFFMSNKPWDSESEIHCPYDTRGSRTTENIKLHQLKLHSKQKFVFIHDFGDENRFEIEFLGTEPLDTEAKYPIIKNVSKDYK